MSGIAASFGLRALRAAVPLVLSVWASSVCGAAAAAEAKTSEGRTNAVAIEHVTALPMTGEGARRLKDVTVIVRNGRIDSIAPAARARVPDGVPRIDGTGKWLMPALMDCHVHIANDRMARLILQAPDLADGTVDTADALLPYAANGVLQVINMSAMAESVAQRDAVESGRILGPHIALAGMIDGSPSIWPPGMTRVAATPEDGRRAVREIKAEGSDYVKTYSALRLDTFTAILDEARKLRMKVLGHIPGRGQGAIEQYLQPGFSMVAHAEEYAYQAKELSDAEIAAFVKTAKRNGTGLIATLTTDERILEQVRRPESLRQRPEVRYVGPALRAFWLERNPYLARPAQQFDGLERIIDFNRRLVKAFVDAGVPVVAGTDSAVPGVVPGFALHDELVALARAGLTPEQVLAATTRLPAQWLGVAADRGTLEKGKRADLLLLDADPLEDVSHTRRIAAVIAGGRHLDRAELDRRLEALATRYASASPIGAAQPTKRDD